MIPQTMIAVDLSAKAVRSGRKGRMCDVQILLHHCSIGGNRPAAGPGGHRQRKWTLIDDFNDGNDDGWTRFDGSAAEPWGPGTYDASSGAYHLLGGGVVPRGYAGWMASIWDASSDPLYSDGFLKAKVRSNDETVLVMLGMRSSDTVDFTYYAFGANPVNGVFYLSKFRDGAEVFVDRFRS